MVSFFAMSYFILSYVLVAYFIICSLEQDYREKHEQNLIKLFQNLEYKNLIFY